MDLHQNQRLGVADPRSEGLGRRVDGALVREEGLTGSLGEPVRQVDGIAGAR